MNDGRRIRIRDDRTLKLPDKCARSVFVEIFRSRRTEICFGRPEHDCRSGALGQILRQIEGVKKIFRRFDFGMNFFRVFSNSSSTVLHNCTATLTHRNTATYLLNAWQGWVIVNTVFSAMGVRILRGNS